MYQDTFEEDDLIAEVELVAQARYSSNVEVDDKFDTEGKLTFFFFISFTNSSLYSRFQSNNKYSDS